MSPVDKSHEGHHDVPARGVDIKVEEEAFDFVVIERAGEVAQTTNPRSLFDQGGAWRTHQKVILGRRGGFEMKLFEI